jgi:Flp pilus assembly protein TadG
VNDQRGSSSLELVFLAPVLLSVMLLVAAFGRHAHTQAYIDQAARDAARTATATRDAATAKQAVNDTIEADLASAPPSCRDSAEHTVTSSTGSFEPSSPYTAYPIGDEPGLVVLSVTVTCDVDVSDLSFIGIGHLTLTSTFSSPMPALYGVYCNPICGF